MDSLKKLLKKINPKREFPSDIAKKTEEEKTEKKQRKKDIALYVEC